MRELNRKLLIVEDDLAVIGEVLDGGHGVAVRAVEGLRNDPPSSEAVEFEAIDAVLPRAVPPAEFGIPQPVPVVRSKLHGHRGVRGYDPRLVEFVPLSPAYYDYLVSCSTEAQAVGIADVSTLGKIDIQGKDAARFLDFVYTNTFSTVGVGKVRYGLMLREDGIVLDDGTSARFGPEHYVLSTTTAAAGRPQCCGPPRTARSATTNVPGTRRFP